MFNLSQSDIERFWSFVDRKGPDDCWLWMGGGNPKRYGHFSIGPRETAITALAHRISYFLAYGVTNLQVLHRCDTPRCVNPAHLFEGTQKVNRVDCKQKDRTAKGTEHGKHVYTEDEVLEAVRLYYSGHRICDIASRLRMTQGAVWNIVNGKSWAWLTGVTSCTSKAMLLKSRV